MNTNSSHDYFEEMINVLAPEGNLNLTKIVIGDRFFNYDFIVSCVKELERKSLINKQDEISHLEKLAIIVLSDSFKYHKGKTNE